MSVLRECVKFIVERETSRSGSVPNARRALARRYKIAPGTWERAQGGTHKKIDATLLMAVIEELQAECLRLQHWLQILHQTGAPVEDMFQAQTMLRDLRALLRMD